MRIKKYSAYPVILMLIVTLLTNGITLSFQAELFAHELDHVRQALPPNPATHLESHRENVFRDGGELDAATHLCLHSAGQYQPFYFILIPLIPSLEGKEILAVYSPIAWPESVPDLPYHPPRKIINS